MLNAANDLNSVEAMYAFNKLILNFEKIKDFDKIKCAIYYHTTISQ